jgi:hypothetical protein
VAGLYETLMAATPQQAFSNNQQYTAMPGQSSYDTKLPQMDEFQFRQWLADKNVTFNADAGGQDYDMRGYWQGLMQQNPHATSGMNANDGRMHFSDYWKTPYHQSFSNESKYAAPNAPQWVNDSQLAAPNGRILFDERR